MQLSRLTLTEFCHHKSLVVDFPIGITGIVGPNGCGKSTIAHALQFAVLGESGNEGTKADDLNWRAAADGGTGSVELTLKKDGIEGKLKRAVQVARASLKFDSINARSVSNVNTELLKLLGRSKHIIETIVFVMQDCMKKVLFDRPADRKRNMHALFGIDKTEPIRVLLRVEIGSLNLSPLDDRLVQIKSRIETEIDPLLRSVSEDRKKLSDEIAGQDDEKLKQVVAQFEAATTLTEHVTKMEQELHRLQSQPVVDVAALAQQLAERKKVVDDNTAAVEATKQQLASMESDQQVSKTRTDLLSKYEALKQALEQPAPVKPDFGPELVEQGSVQVEEARAEIAPKRAFVRAFDGQSDAICPTCQQTVKDAGALAERMKQEIAEREQLIAAVTATVNTAGKALRDFETQTMQYESTITDANNRSALIEQTLQSMPEVTAYDEQAAITMRQAIKLFSQRVAELVQFESQYNTAAQQKAAHDAQVGSIAQSIQQARQQMVQQAPPEQYQKAKTMLDFLSATREKLAELEGRFKQLQEQRASSIKEQQSLEAQAKKIDGLKKYQSLCERARTVLHYDNLPRLAMQRYLGLLNSKLNQFLAIFGVPFTCTIKNDLSVICNIPDIGEKPAERLSGGQKVMLGIAFRIAVYNMFASDLGFMVLDEPTNMLDDDRIEDVATMFELIGQYARNAKMQLVVITHKEALMRTFDHTVQL